MRRFLVDSSVLLDVATEDPRWFSWSAEQIAVCASAGQLVINPIIYAEVSVGFERIEQVDDALSRDVFLREALPYAAGFLAGKAFLGYRRRGGSRTTPLPDFFIGAHAAIAGYRLITRDAARVRAYFPKVALICPT